MNQIHLDKKMKRLWEVITTLPGKVYLGDHPVTEERLRTTFFKLSRTKKIKHDT